MKVCIVGASGKLGRYMVQHALDRGYEEIGVCREQSVAKLDESKGRITVALGATNDREVIKKAVPGCDGVLTVTSRLRERASSSPAGGTSLRTARTSTRGSSVRTLSSRWRWCPRLESNQRHQV